MATKASDLQRLATRIRLNATRMVAIQGFGYLGQALSSAEILAVLFGGGFVRASRDRFVLSPGHYVIGFYAVAAEVGQLNEDELASYGKDGALLEAIGTERTPLVDLVCGSLGQGLSGAHRLCTRQSSGWRGSGYIRLSQRRRDGRRSSLGGGDVRFAPSPSYGPTRCRDRRQ